MNSAVSTEKPKGVAIREIAQRAVSHQAKRRQDAAGRRPGDRPHRQRRARLPADPRRLHQRAVRRQRAGHARHRAIAVRHQPGRASGARRSGRGRARTSPAGDQPHPPRRRHPPGRRAGRADQRHHVRVREAQRRFPAGRQHPRRRPAARRDHRRAGSPAANARARSATSPSA